MAIQLNGFFSATPTYISWLPVSHMVCCPSEWAVHKLEGRLKAIEAFFDNKPAFNAAGGEATVPVMARVKYCIIAPIIHYSSRVE